MAGKPQPHRIMSSPHGEPVALNPLMVTHITGRGASECIVWFMGGSSVALKGTSQEVADLIFSRPA